MEVPTQTSREQAEAPASSTAKRCRNCGARLTGPFCAECGQEACRRDVPLRRLGRELLGEVFSFDARLWRTLVPLLTKPGHLTREYFAGRRKRYVPPLRLYVFVSFVYFLVFALPGTTPFFVDDPFIADEPQASAAAPADSLQSSGALRSPAQPDETETPEQSEPRSVGYEVGRIMGSYFSAFLFALVPVIALGLRFFYPRSGWLYVHHFVFALHLQAFLFVAMLPRMVLGAVLPEGFYLRLADPLMWTILAAFALYALLAAQRFYARGRWVTAFKTLLLIAWYAVAVVLCMVALAGGTLLYREIAVFL